MWSVFFSISAACESGNCSPSLYRLCPNNLVFQNIIGSISCDRLHYFISIHVRFHKAYSSPSLAGSAWHIHSSSWLIGDWPLSKHHIGAAHGWVSQSLLIQILGADRESSLGQACDEMRSTSLLASPQQAYQPVNLLRTSMIRYTKAPR